MNSARQAPISWARAVRRMALPSSALLAAVLVAVLTYQNRAMRREIRELRRTADQPHPGMVVPSFVGVTLSGDSVAIAARDASPRQVLFVFNTRCPFCAAALGTWKTVFDALKATDVSYTAVYGLSLDPEEDTRRYVHEQEVRFPVLVLPDERLVSLYRLVAVPLTLMVNAEGTVLYARFGQLSDGAVDSLLGVTTADQ